MITQSYSSYVGEATIYTVDWDTKVTGLGTSVSTAAWEVCSGTAVISGDTLSSNITSATVTTDFVGTSIIKVTATFADAEIDVWYFQLRTTEPECV